MNDFPIERARPSDAEQIFALYTSLLTCPFCTWDEEYPSREFVENDLVAHDVFIIRRDGRIIAALVSAADNDLDSIAPWYEDVRSWRVFVRIGVDKAYQGHGLARRLLAHAIDEARRQGFEGVRMLVSPGNLPAIRAYSKLDFDVCGEADHYEEHWQCWQKRLTSAKPTA